jgi:hypothetical protein
MHYLLILATLLLSACATNHATIVTHDSDVFEVIVHSLEYNDKGLPVVGTPLEKRPSKPGEYFTLVQLSKGRPVMSYDVSVLSEKPDLTKPFKTIYHWTGKGFTLYKPSGFNCAEYTTHLNECLNPVFAVVAVVDVVGIAGGIAGGIVVGVADGIKQTGLELSKVVLNEEQVMTCTVFEYDKHDRLISMRMMTPDRSTELALTRFEYEDERPTPNKAVVESPIEKKVYQVGLPSWMEHWKNK